MSRLIIGCSIGYHPEQIHRFLKSWRRHAADCPLHLIVGKQDVATMKVLNAYGAAFTAVPAPYGSHEGSFRKRLLYKFIYSNRKIQPPKFNKRQTTLSKLWMALLWALHWRLHSVSVSRNWSFVRLLEAQRRKGHHDMRVLLTDVRDVVFQDDPLRWEPFHDLMLAVEAHALRFDASERGADNCNNRWISTPYGQEVLNQLHGKQIICGGTVMGRLKPVLDLCHKLAWEAIARANRTDASLGWDQGFLNALFHLGAVPGATLCHNFEGPFLTAMFESFEEQTALPLKNRDGSVIPVLHQYDRISWLDREIGSLFDRD